MTYKYLDNDISEFVCHNLKQTEHKVCMRAQPFQFLISLCRLRPLWHSACVRHASSVAVSGSWWLLRLIVQPLVHATITAPSPAYCLWRSEDRVFPGAGATVRSVRFLTGYVGITIIALTPHLTHLCTSPTSLHDQKYIDVLFNI